MDRIVGGYTPLIVMWAQTWSQGELLYSNTILTRVDLTRMLDVCHKANDTQAIHRRYRVALNTHELGPQSRAWGRVLSPLRL